MTKASLPSFDDILDDLAAGEASPVTVARCVALKFEQGVAARDAQRLYDSCSAFVFKAVRSPRGESEMAAWLDVLGRVAVVAGKAKPLLAHKFEVFIELMHRSRAIALSLDVETLVRRKHVRSIFLTMTKKGGAASRQQLMRACDLGSPNLSRVIGPLLDTGLVSRETHSREVVYKLTLEGRRIARELDVEQRKAKKPVRVRGKPGSKHTRSSVADATQLVAGRRGKAIVLPGPVNHAPVEVTVTATSGKSKQRDGLIFAGMRICKDLPVPQSKRKHAAFASNETEYSIAGLDDKDSKSEILYGR